MRRISIIHIGAFKAGERAYRDLADEYLKRLGSEFKVSQTEAKSCREVPARLSPGAYKIALCVEGKRLSSGEFAGLIYDKPALDFIIGGPDGLDGAVKSCADLLFSLSEMTFNHRLARVMLAEQLYRAYAIKNGLGYNR